MIQSLFDELNYATQHIGYIHVMCTSEVSHEEVTDKIYSMLNEYIDPVREAIIQHDEKMLDPCYSAQRLKIADETLPKMRIDDVYDAVDATLQRLYGVCVAVHEQDILTGFKAVVLEGLMRDLEIWIEYKLKMWMGGHSGK